MSTTISTDALAHLFLGTVADNAADREAKGRGKYARKSADQ